jgi:hypothetical protein
MDYIPGKGHSRAPSAGTFRRSGAALKPVTARFHGEETRRRGKPEGVRRSEPRRTFLDASSVR